MKLPPRHVQRTYRCLIISVLWKAVAFEQSYPPLMGQLKSPLRFNAFLQALIWVLYQLILLRIGFPDK